MQDRWFTILIFDRGDTKELLIKTHLFDLSSCSFGFIRKS